jgi:SWIM zinc finger
MAVDAARRILENSGNRGSMGRQVSPAEIHYVNDDGRRYFVAVYVFGEVIGGAECSCGSVSVCAHLLAVLAKHDHPLG